MGSLLNFNIGIDMLVFANNVEGKPGGSIILDAGVVKHGLIDPVWRCKSEDYDEDPDYDLITIGVPNKPITIDDVIDAFMEVLEITPYEGRTYYCEGIDCTPVVDKERNTETYKLNWGT